MRFITADKMDPFPGELIVYHMNSSTNVDQTSSDFLPDFQKREVKPSVHDTIRPGVCVGEEIHVILTSGHCYTIAYTHVWSLLFFPNPPDCDPR